MDNTITISKQKLDLDEAERFLHVKIEKFKEDERILIAAIKSIDENQENILEGRSILAGEAKRIMIELSQNY